ncbi:MAG: 2-octaprenyl-6-methoxyphenyl hydroxylase [Methylobacter sp.]|nr:MAG: 2-octaprenyl-6-methoxyphenyl hydroxylase [Methylobacter sp.]
MQYDYDLLIAGGGLAGNCLALALKGSGLRIAIIEANTRAQQQAAPAGDRALALAAGTVNALETLGIWQGIADKATAIKHIHISDRGHFGKARLSAEKNHVPALGYVITARDIEGHLADLVGQGPIDVIAPARLAGLMPGGEAINVSLKQGNDSINLSAKLLVGADGGMSSVRALLDIPQHSTDYRQTALVTTVKSSLPHHNTAYERFTASGPLALLPQGTHHSSVVWTRTTDEAEALMLGSEKDFLNELQDCFGFRLGELALTAPRRAFPLSLIRAETMQRDRAVIIGNAAHQLHPVAGQGFNLGLRDVMQLAANLTGVAQNQHDIGSRDVLSAYTQARLKDHARVIGFTDSVVKIFSNDWLAIAAARNLGLAVLDHIPSAKAALAKQAMGLANWIDQRAS